MLDVVTAACFCVTVDAVFALGLRAECNTACDRIQVDGRHRRSGGFWSFRVCAGLVMADQAVYIGGILEIKGIVCIANTRMALRATPFVTGYCDTEVVQQVILAVRLALEASHSIGFTLPLEVAHLQGG